MINNMQNNKKGILMLKQQSNYKFLLVSLLACATISGAFANAAGRDNTQWPKGRPTKQEYTETRPAATRHPC